MSNGAWSNDLTTSLTLPTGATDPSQRIVLDGTSDTILVYDSTGALIASVAANAGTDGFGHIYPAGISSTSGVISNSIILLYSGTPTLGNLVTSLAAMPGTDSFGNNYASGFGTYNGAINTDHIDNVSGNARFGNAASSHFSFDVVNSVLNIANASAANTVVVDAIREAMFFYGPSTNVLTYSTFGTYTIKVPPGITSCRVQAWGAGGGGQFSSGAGGGGGEYAEEPALSVTPGNTLTITVGGGGAGGISGVGTAGTNSTVTGGALTLTAHGGPGSTSATTAGGTGSTNTIHHDGGGSHANTTGIGAGGAGGGEGGGQTATGGAGASNVGATGGAGGSGTTGGNGGKGGSVVANVGQDGTNGSNPGGAGGAGGAGSSGSGFGGNGADGQIIITFSNPNSIQTSIAATSGTDTFGNTFVNGVQVGSNLGANVTIDTTPKIDMHDKFQNLSGRIDPVNSAITLLENSPLAPPMFIQLSNDNTDPVNPRAEVNLGVVTTPGSMPTANDVTTSGGMSLILGGGGAGEIKVASAYQLGSGTGQDGQTQLFLGAAGSSPGGFASPGTVSLGVFNSTVPATGIPVLMEVAGAAEYTEWRTGFSPGWQNFTAATGWTNNSFRYRIDVEDNLHIVGELTFTGTSTALASISTSTTAVPAQYRLKNQQRIAVAHYSSSGVQKNTAASMRVNTDGTTQIQWGVAATGDTNGMANGDLIWIAAVLPLDNIS